MRLDRLKVVQPREAQSRCHLPPRHRHLYCILRLNPRSESHFGGTARGSPRPPRSERPLPVLDLVAVITCFPLLLPRLSLYIINRNSSSPNLGMLTRVIRSNLSFIDRRRLLIILI